MRGGKMMEKDIFHESFYDGIIAINQIAADLGYLSMAFEATGNEKVSDVLIAGAKSLVRTIEIMRTAYGVHIDFEYKKSQEATKVVLESVFAGIKLKGGELCP